MQSQTQQISPGNAQWLGIDPESTFAENVPILKANTSTGIKERLLKYNEDPNNNVTLGDVEQKADAVAELLHKSNAILVETEPWLVNKHMGTEEYDRWEPFFVAFPEVTFDNQIKVSNLAPVSEISYQIKRRDEHLTEATKNPDDVTTSDTNEYPIIKAQQNEQLAFSRHPLDSCADEAALDHSIVESIYVNTRSWPEHLLVGIDDNDQLYCGRGELFEDVVDVAIGLDRRVSDYNERKVAIFNDKSTKNALKALPWDETYIKYRGNEQRWEANMDAINTIITELLQHESIDYVSLHRITEKAYKMHLNHSFGSNIDGYPGFNQ